MFRRPFVAVNKKIANNVAKKLTWISSELKFTLLTYNMLSLSYMWYKICTYVIVNSKYQNLRYKLLEYLITHLYKADIPCFQEITPKNYEEFWATVALQKLQMKSKFTPKTAPKYGTSSEDHLDDCSIF